MKQSALEPYVTVADMKSVLRSKGWSISGTRSDLKERIDALKLAEEMCCAADRCYDELQEHCAVSDPSNNKRREQCSVSDPTNKRPKVEAKPESQSE